MAIGHFEKLGPSPFTVVDMVGPDDSFIGDSPFKGVEGDTDRCECCGKKLSWRVILNDNSGKPHVVGRSCAETATDLKGVSLRDAELKAKKKMITHWMASKEGAEFRTWATTIPHPKGWRGKTLLDDLNYWTRKGTEKGLSKLRKALKAYGQNDAGELLDAERKAQDHRAAKRRKNAAYLIRNRMMMDLRHARDLDPWTQDIEVAKTLGDSDETIEKLKADLLKRYGEPKDWDAKEKEIRELNDEALWNEAEKRGWVRDGRYR